MRWLLFALLAVASPAVAAPTKSPAAVVDPWSAMIEKATPAIVSIDIVSTRAFDTERASHSYATGFVVDAERGIILTNRHVVEPGPVRSEAIFQDQEVVPLRAIYRDPVHDFGFYQFDPADVKYMKVAALELDPAGAKVGTEIRVLGNNAGEKLSIHTGTIARLDRDAPRYSPTGYNDFNTFYIQAAAGTTGGSSGSPVLDVDGTVVALNAGARRDSAASFYLPLDRVVRALEFVRGGKPVPRGNIQAVLGYTAYDELDRLGLSDATEAAARKRNPEGKGLLVVREVLPGGPSDQKLMVGDVLVTVNGAPVDAFIPVETALDDNVGRSVKFGVERGGRALEVEVTVADLHATAPSEYVEFGGDLLHALSYQQARNYNVPAQGVYVASTGYSLKHGGVPEGVRLDSIGGVPVPDLEALWRVLQTLPEHARVEVRYTAMSEARRQQVASLLVDRTFFPMRRCKRDDATGRWPCVDAPPAPPAAPVIGATAALQTPPKGAPGKVAHSLVYVETRLPLVLAGNNGDFYTGVGLVLNAARGLVLVDRDTVPQMLADVTVVVGGTLRVPATPVYFPPEHNFAIIQYDPALVGATPLADAPLEATRPVTGDHAWQVGLNSRQELVWSETSIEGFQPFTLISPAVPQYREYNVDLIATVDPPLDKGGVIVDLKGKVRAFLASFVDGSGKGQSAKFIGLPVDTFAEAAQALAEGRPPPAATLGVAWKPIPLSAAQDRGLSAAEATAMATVAKSRRILAATYVAPDAPAARHVRPGDLLLAVNGRPTSSWRTLETALSGPLTLALWRDGQRVVETVEPQRVSTTDIDRALVWAGAILHAPHRPMVMQQGVPPTGVYVSWRWFGSPSDKYDLDPTWRIEAVDDVLVPDLDAFKAAVAGRADRDPVRLRVVDLDGRTRVVTLRLDLDYWPAYDFRRVDGRWTRTGW